MKCPDHQHTHFLSSSNPARPSLPEFEFSGPEALRSVARPHQSVAVIGGPQGQRNENVFC
jgi:hypothetical protein